MKHALKGIFLCAAMAGIAAAEAAPKSRPATPKEIALIRSFLDDVLKDADSAKFKDVVIWLKPGAEPVHSICGQINSKNSYGAYGGYKTFFGALVPDKKEPMALVISMDEVADAMCEKEKNGTGPNGST